MGLVFSHGEFLVIYDAEDRPEPGQLREAVAAFRSANADWLERGFGLWTLHGGGRDGDEFEETVRPCWSTVAKADTGLDEA
jgi:hypothetical protein